MAITFSDNIEDFVLPDKARIINWLTAVITEHGMTVGSIAYFFCNDEFILEANRRYLNHDTYTDIITFDYVEGELVSGDIMISVDRVRDNSAKFGVSFDDEIHRVIVHGVLHLLGQGDKSDEEAKQMRRREEDALRLLANII